MVRPTAAPTTRKANRIAADKFVSELKRQGRIEDIDCLGVRIVRGIADALDQDPSNAQLWKQLREAKADMLRTNDSGDDVWDQFQKEVNSGAKVGHPPET